LTTRLGRSPRHAGRMMLVMIVGCEVGFWLLLAAGLAVRYLLRRPRAGAVLLLGVPLVDLVLLVASVVDLRRGAAVTSAHGLAAAYLGFTVVFGHRTVRWADGRFAHRFAGGPPPPRPPRGGRARTRYEWLLWGRIVLAYLVSVALIGAMVLLVGDPHRARPLELFALGLARVPLIALIWPVSYTIWPGRPAVR
jgi:hypothetical protein